MQGRPVYSGLVEGVATMVQRSDLNMILRVALVRSLLVLSCVVFPFVAAAQSQGHSPYAGLEAREIKSLSASDLEELRRGGGWGLALAAELNGVPGPAHLLEFRDELGLTPDQVASIEAIFTEMQVEAREAGERLIAAEAAIEVAFRSGEVDADTLRTLISDAEAARADLRFVHLSRHIETPPLLSQAQVSAYSRLRGYQSHPCENVPEGHDAEMWRRHNNCG